MVRSAPQVLCIQLLRFDANGQKINQEVDYPPELTVPNYQDGSETSTTKYNLSSIIVHQRRNEGLPKVQRAATQLINIQTFYSQRAVRLKIIVKYCHFCFEDLVFSKVCLDNFLV